MRRLHRLQKQPTGRHPLRAMACGLVVLCLAISWPLQASERAHFGTTPYPIWSELTFFERTALGDLHRARSDDPDALLALYLVASGVRTSADYETARQRIRQFVRQSREQIVEDRDDWLVGKLLNEKMHQTFFLQTESRGTAPSGYDMDQSRLMGIFESGEYNCISASLLYAVIARHFRLQVQGVLLPSHAFIQLNLRDGRQIDVETTSPTGYDQVHDEAFYARNNNDWFASRGLQPATYEDYRNRRRVSATELAAQNMLNQHTAPARMSEQDSARLAEISAFIDPSNPMAQTKRLYFYNREIHALVVAQDWPTLQRLFATTYQNVMSTSARLPGATSLQQGLQMYLSGAMLTHAQAGDVEQTLAVMGELLSRGLAFSDSREEVELRVTNAVSLLMSSLAEHHRFDEGLLVLSVVEGHLSDPQAWPDMMRWFYLRWAETHWNQSRWQDVVEVLQEYLAHAGQGPDRSKAQELVASAYHNWVLELTNARDLDQADGVLEQCRVLFNDTTCAQATALLTRARRQQRS